MHLFTFLLPAVFADLGSLPGVTERDLSRIFSAEADWLRQGVYCLREQLIFERHERLSAWSWPVERHCGTDRYCCLGGDCLMRVLKPMIVEDWQSRVALAGAGAQ